MEKPQQQDPADLIPTATPDQDRVSERESIELQFTDLSSPVLVAGLARRC